MRHIIGYCVFLLFGVAVSGGAYAQQHPERHHIRSGNRTYENLEYENAEQAYRTAAIKSPQSAESEFNLAAALYKQKRYQEAENTLKNLTSRENSLLPEQAAQAFYNLGNAQFAQQKLNEALDSYKQSLRLNPDDKEAKYNYAYTKKLLEKNNDQNQDNRNNKDNQNQDNQNDKNQNDKNNQEQNDQNNNKDNQDKNNPDQNQDNRNNNNDKNNGNDQDQPAPPQKQDDSPQKGGMSQQEAEQILNAIQGQEDKTREKVEAQKAVTVGRSGKNW